jgi:hypothetical protein
MLFADNPGIQHDGPRENTHGDELEGSTEVVVRQLCALFGSSTWRRAVGELHSCRPFVVDIENEYLQICQNAG